jgi:hypothetical protein
VFKNCSEVVSNIFTIGESLDYNPTIWFTKLINFIFTEKCNCIPQLLLFITLSCVQFIIN